MNDINDDAPYVGVVPQSLTKSWLQAHQTGIGASEIAAVLGENPYQSRIRVWAHKTGALEPPDLSDVEPVQWGLRLEPLVAERYREATGRPLVKAGVLLRSKDIPWAICTPDYWYHGLQVGPAMPLQIKTTGAYRINDWADGPPAPVWWQVQHEMLVTGAAWASVAVLVGGQRFLWADVEREEGAIARIIKEGTIFWDAVRSQQMPDPDYTEDATAVLGEIYSETAEETVYLPVEAVDWAATIEALDATVKAAKSESDNLKNHIRVAMGSTSLGLFLDGSGGFTHKAVQRKGYEVKPSEYRQLRRFKTVP